MTVSNRGYCPTCESWGPCCQRVTADRYAWYGIDDDGRDHPDGGHVAAHMDGLCDCDELRVPGQSGGAPQSYDAKAEARVLEHAERAWMERLKGTLE